MVAGDRVSTGAGGVRSIILAGVGGGDATQRRVGVGVVDLAGDVVGRVGVEFFARLDEDLVTG